MIIKSDIIFYKLRLFVSGIKKTTQFYLFFDNGLG